MSRGYCHLVNCEYPMCDCKRAEELPEAPAIPCACGNPDADRKCICGWWNCADCAADGCHNTRCDRLSMLVDD